MAWDGFRISNKELHIGAGIAVGLPAPKGGHYFLFNFSSCIACVSKVFWLNHSFKASGNFRLLTLFLWETFIPSLVMWRSQLLHSYIRQCITRCVGRIQGQRMQRRKGSQGSQALTMNKNRVGNQKHTIFIFLNYSFFVGPVIAGQRTTSIIVASNPRNTHPITMYNNWM